MPTPEEPDSKPAEKQQDTESVRGDDTLSLVDYFDQRDRDAFRRSLQHRGGSSDYNSDSS